MRVGRAVSWRGSSVQTVALTVHQRQNLLDERGSFFIQTNILQAQLIRHIDLSRRSMAV